MALTDRSQRTSATPGLRRTGALVAGDLVAFHVVTAIGLLSHGELTGLGALGEVVWIATPFAAGWFVVAPFLGAYKAEVVAAPRRALPRVALAWLIALPIGLLLWSIVRQKTVQPAFAIVTFVTNLIVLLGWRGAFAIAARGRGR
jgi:Protein of unknown function (DUF3054)